jgi:hemolysin III
VSAGEQSACSTIADVTTLPNADNRQQPCMNTTTEPMAKPTWRGVLHQHAAFAALGAGTILVAMAPTSRAAWAAAVFAASLVLLFGVSATYHRLHWQPGPRAWMKRADHACIFVLIAGSYTPTVLLGLRADVAGPLLIGVWLGALLGVLQSMFWVHAPRFVVAVLAVGLGWTIVPYWHEATQTAGWTVMLLLAAGGVVYTVGALMYALKRPKLWPATFSYHEAFHACTLIAATLHFGAVLLLVLNAR